MNAALRLPVQAATLRRPIAHAVESNVAGVALAAGRAAAPLVALSSMALISVAPATGPSQTTVPKKAARRTIAWNS